MCDDGGKGGCKEDCSGSKEDHICQPGGTSSPSVCSSTSKQGKELVF